MAKNNSGKDYETLVHRVFSALTEKRHGATVRLDENITGPEGPRQVDITIRHCVAGIEYLTAIECRDYNKRIDIKNIDGFCSKLSDIKASKGIIVTRIGYSKNAIQKAKRKGIDLLIADKASNIKIDGFESVPVLFCRIKVLAVGSTFRLQSSVPKSLKIGVGTPINGITPTNILMDSYKRGFVEEVKSYSFISEISRNFQSRTAEFDSIIDLTRFFENNPAWVEDSDGAKHLVTEPFLLFKTNIEWYFGHVQNIESALQMIDPDKGFTHIVFDASELNTLDTNFIPIKSPDEIPEYAKNFGLKILIVDTSVPLDEAVAEVYRNVPKL